MFSKNRTHCNSILIFFETGAYLHIFFSTGNLLRFTLLCETLIHFAGDSGNTLSSIRKAVNISLPSDENEVTEFGHLPSK